ncbi:MAG: rhodanese-like domain-containing protein [Clostridiaceae bacterium]
MKKTLTALLAILILVPSLAACTPAATATTANTTTAVTAAPVTMKKMSADEASALIGKDGYKFIDLRKAADFSVSTVKSAVSADLAPAVEGDAAAGIAKMKEVTKDVSDTLILVCYTGNKYAQAATDALSAIGYDMNKVVTLEGGFKEFSASKPELIVPNK